MAVRKIVKLGHPTLTKKAAPIREITPDIVALAEDMIETMFAAPGLGLSAPQVDDCRRVIVVDLGLGEKKGQALALVNPEIVSAEGRVVREEGCLSVPEVFENVARPQKVIARGLDLEGRERTIEATDLLARILCHEIDHLEGRLFIELLSPLKKSLIKRKFRRQAEARA